MVYKQVNGKSMIVWQWQRHPDHSRYVTKIAIRFEPKRRWLCFCVLLVQVLFSGEWAPQPQAEVRAQAPALWGLLDHDHLRADAHGDAGGGDDGGRRVKCDLDRCGQLHGMSSSGGPRCVTVLHAIGIWNGWTRGQIPWCWF
jgi:hypothetical protein